MAKARNLYLDIIPEYALYRHVDGPIGQFVDIINADVSSEDLSRFGMHGFRFTHADFYKTNLYRASRTGSGQVGLRNPCSLLARLRALAELAQPQ